MGIETTNTDTLRQDLNQVIKAENLIIRTLDERLTPENITKRQTYIQAERSKYAPQISSDEPTFQAWEKMIKNYNEALEKSRMDQSSVTSSPIKIPSVASAVSETPETLRYPDKAIAFANEIRKATSFPFIVRYTEDGKSYELPVSVDKNMIIVG